MASLNLPPFASSSTIAHKATRQTCFVALPVAVLPHVSCSGAPVAQQHRRHHRTFWAHQALPPETPQQAPQGDQDEFDGLLPEEDTEVPGGYTEAMNPQTRLGKAVSAACKELGTLNSLERSSLEQADSLLKKLGFKMSLMPTDPPAFDDVDEEEAAAGGQDSAAAAPTPEPAKFP